MIYLKNNCTDPAINHGIEEYLMKETDDEIFSLWQNIPVVLIGKNQDAYAEVNIDYAEKNNIKIVRRLSGGGTIFCDLENMQYSFIRKTDDTKNFNTFEKFAQPMVQFLRSLNLNAEFTGRNDILIDGKKISGNAKYSYKNRILHHGTLIFDINSEIVKNVLYSRPIQFKTKSVSSITSRIGKISEYFPQKSVKEFMNSVIDYIIDYYNIQTIIEVDEKLIKAAEPYTEKFRDKNRNLGVKYNNWITASIRYDFGLIEYKILFKGNKIKDIKIQGNYFEEKPIEEFLQKLQGINFTAESLNKALQINDISFYIKGMTNEIFVGDLMNMKGCKENQNPIYMEVG